MTIKPKCSSGDEQTTTNWNRGQLTKSKVNQKKTEKYYILCIFIHFSVKSRWFSMLLSIVYPQGKMNHIYLCSCRNHGHNVCEADHCQMCGLLDAAMSVDIMNIH